MARGFLKNNHHIYSWGVKTALCKISRFFDENPEETKLNIFCPFFQKCIVRRWCSKVGMAPMTVGIDHTHFDILILHFSSHHNPAWLSLLSLLKIFQQISCKWTNKFPFGTANQLSQQNLEGWLVRVWDGDSWDRSHQFYDLEWSSHTAVTRGHFDAWSTDHCNCIVILIWQTRFTEIAVSRKL